MTTGKQGLRKQISLAIIVALIAMLGVVFGQYFAHTRGLRTVRINNARILIEEAVGADAQAKGLGGRASLGSKNGMLFRFTEPKIATFWMKDMQFPLDFIWIQNNTVVDLHQHIAAPIPSQIDKDLVLYSPKAPVDAVIEVNAGFVAYYNITIGDKVSGL